jgi:hypothetical protein
MLGLRDQKDAPHHIIDRVSALSGDERIFRFQNDKNARRRRRLFRFADRKIQSAYCQGETRWD